MTRVLLFNLLQIVVSAYAITRGGAPERVAGATLLVAALTTRVVGQHAALQFASVQVGVLIVDLVLLAVLLGLTLFADRWWTFWAASLHILGSGAHLVRALDPNIERMAYAILAAAWSYPILMLLVAGTFRHQQRLRWEGADLDWSDNPSGP